MSFLIPFELDFKRLRTNRWFKLFLLVLGLVIVSGKFYVGLWFPRLLTHGGSYPYFVLHCLELVVGPVILFLSANQLIGKALTTKEIRLWFLQATSKSSIFLGKLLAALGAVALVYAVSFVVSIGVTLLSSGLASFSILRVLLVYINSLFSFLPMIPLSFLIVLVIRNLMLAFFSNLTIYYGLLGLEKIELTIFKEKELRVLAPSTFYNGHVFTLPQFLAILLLTLLALISVYHLALRRFKQIEI